MANHKIVSKCICNVSKRDERILQVHLSTYEQHPGLYSTEILIDEYDVYNVVTREFRYAQFFLFI